MSIVSCTLFTMDAHYFCMGILVYLFYCYKFSDKIQPKRLVLFVSQLKVLFNHLEEVKAGI